MPWAIALLIVGIDQWSKWLVVTHMEVGARIPVWGTFFSITSHRNTGAAWGMFSGATPVLAAISVCVAVIVAVMIVRARHAGTAMILACILGGGVGNAIDRIVRGEVVDFFHVVFSIGTWRYAYPIFNVADMAIVCGVLLYAVRALITDVRAKRRV
ncbi:MAG: signal peptidase II [Paenibacillaceae bacterium]|nr:signal peptidase II [Paenibacillaceae bacterium]